MPVSAEGLNLGGTVALPFMNTQNNADNIKTFAAKFRAKYNNDKAKALAEYKFGDMAKSDNSMPFGNATNRGKYVTDALAVGDDVKKKLSKLFVDNYFSAEPKPMRFLLSTTKRLGGDCWISHDVEDADNNKFILVRVLCESTAPA